MHHNEICESEDEITEAYYAYVDTLMAAKQIEPDKPLAAQFDQAKAFFDMAKGLLNGNGEFPAIIKNRNRWYKHTASDDNTNATTVTGLMRITIYDETVEIDHLTGINGGGTYLVAKAREVARVEGKEFVTLCAQDGPLFTGYYKALGFTPTFPHVNVTSGPMKLAAWDTAAEKLDKYDKVVEVTWDTGERKKMTGLPERSPKSESSRNLQKPKQIKWDWEK